MILSGKNAYGKILDPGKYGKIQQVGVDLTVQSIYTPKRSSKFVGCLFKDGTVESDIEWEELDYNESRFWRLVNGVYSVVFDQGIKIPDNLNGVIHSRSSLLRMGSSCEGGRYDPGYSCKNLGAMLFVNEFVLEIEKHAPIAQFVLYENEKVEAKYLYSGQYQGKSI